MFPNFLGGGTCNDVPFNKPESGVIPIKSNLLIIY
ncbi:hypothetical protein CP_0918 [Chlamydia pneumoniae AR39]|uniref:Uncharacterized protein n=1 Tax=Chlamydia pneumoniae TaxID=83558 RepID=Q9K1V4_CHLPN|nr:hypothetical protein CP_0918 [Chlamydia pneumoniae AR39]